MQTRERTSDCIMFLIFAFKHRSLKTALLFLNHAKNAYNCVTKYSP